MNRANEARNMTKKLGALAEKYQCAILLIGHMNKASANKAAYRGMGSIDFFAVARSVLLVGRIEGEPNTRAVIQIKNNLVAFGHPKAFMLSETGFHWLGDYEITADEVLGGIAPKANKLEQAKQMLRELAETTNMVQSNEVFEMADEQGISKRTLENAKKELGIKVNDPKLMPTISLESIWNDLRGMASSVLENCSPNIWELKMMPILGKSCSFLCWQRYIGYMSRAVSMKLWCVL